MKSLARGASAIASASEQARQVAPKATEHRQAGFAPPTTESAAEARGSSSAGASDLRAVAKDASAIQAASARAMLPESLTARAKPEPNCAPERTASMPGLQSTSGLLSMRPRRRSTLPSTAATQAMMTDRTIQALKKRGEWNVRSDTHLAGPTSTNTALNSWVDRRIADCRVRDDLSAADYEVLMGIALDQSRRNGADSIPQPQLVEAAQRFAAMMSQRIGESAARTEERGTFDAVIPDMGRLDRMGLVAESRHFLKKRYKASSDGAVETVRRKWFEFCFVHARVSPIRPMPGSSFDAKVIEENLWVNFASWLARTVIGSTTTNAISTLKRWHRTVTGWDPISSSKLDFAMLRQHLAGVRAELPSKSKNRFAHPTRLFAKWWEPLQRAGPDGLSVLDVDCYDTSKQSAAHREQLGRHLRGLVVASGMPWTDLRFIIMSACMTAGLLRIGEAAAVAGGEQPVMMRSDVTFHWRADGRLSHVILQVAPLKKGKAAKKMPIVITHSPGRGNVRAAFFLWLLFVVDPVIDGTSTPLFRAFSWEGGKPTTHEPFRLWYKAKMRQSGLEHWQYYNLHSFRIGGATALAGAGVTLEQIKTMGRWDSEVAFVYQRRTFETLVDASRVLDNADVTPFELEDSFFDQVAGVSENEADEWAQAMVAQPELLDFE